MNNEKDKCAICLNDLDNGLSIKTLNCGHRFHNECMNDWILNMRQNRLPRRCPMCRGNMTRDNLRRDPSVLDLAYLVPNRYVSDDVIQIVRRNRRISTLLGLFLLFTIGPLVLRARLNYNFIYYITDIIYRSMYGEFWDENDRRFWVIYMCVFCTIISMLFVFEPQLFGSIKSVKNKTTILAINKKTSLSIKNKSVPSKKTMNLFIDKVLKPSLKDISSTNTKTKLGLLDEAEFNDSIDKNNRVFFNNFMLRVHYLYLGVMDDKKTMEKFFFSSLEKLDKQLDSHPKNNTAKLLKKQIERILN